MMHWRYYVSVSSECLEAAEGWLMEHSLEGGSPVSEFYVDYITDTYGAFLFENKEIAMEFKLRFGK
jgi:SMC interacting uncharacterized protein involved in chromosome segregation